MAPDHLYFESYLEMAALRNTVVEFLAVDGPVPEKMFVDKIIYNDAEVLIRKKDGTVIPKHSLAGIYVSEDPGDLEAISCLCQ